MTASRRPILQPTSLRLPPRRLTLIVREIEHGSAEYRATLELRRRFLREPLGLELTVADTAGEDGQRHFGLFIVENAEPGRLAGSVIAAPPADEHAGWRIRQMVVDAAYRGSGFGRLLLTEAERLLAADGVPLLVLYARAEAAGFYRSCGYEATGETASLIGMPHQEMRKAVSRL
ncbi:MAG: GNAT family N-acetyltransferase [Planctomycetota bacterium]